MKGDFSRTTFDPKKHFAEVLQQQGRVQLDADRNEAEAIHSYRMETTAADLIGPSGAPTDGGGFEILNGDVGIDEAARPSSARDGDVAVDPVFVIGAGRYYVDGILCENEKTVPFSMQPHLPGESPPQVGVFLAYLDVWKRHVAAFEDDTIREKALGGIDTATRSQVVWQVRLHSLLEDEIDGADCDAVIPSFRAATAPSSGTLAARAQPQAVGTVCVLPPTAGYRRTENQLYRVEIHDAAGPRGVTFKWSRDNGSVASSAAFIAPDRIRISQPGRDAVGGFAVGTWVEITTEERELRFQPGVLVPIKGLDGMEAVLDTAKAIGSLPVLPGPLSRECKVRRWDSEGAVAVSSADPTIDSGYLRLEDGVMVKFGEGTYHVGDWWEIPARTILGDIEWPREADGTTPRAVPPRGVVHHYARLAILNFADGRLLPEPRCDCRRMLPPLSRAGNLYYVGGDGQEVPPIPGELAALVPLPRPLQVGVANGGIPVADTPVEFIVRKGSGLLDGGLSTVRVRTNASGIASCGWSLRGAEPSQQVEARWLGCRERPRESLPVLFTATWSMAARVSYDPKACDRLEGALTVQEAIDRLCRECRGCCRTVGEGGDFKDLGAAVEDAVKRKEMCVCIRLLPGVHRVEAPFRIKAPAGGSLHIEGCGSASRLRVFGEGDLAIGGFASARIESFDGEFVEATRLSLDTSRKTALVELQLQFEGKGAGPLITAVGTDVSVEDSTVVASANATHFSATARGQVRLARTRILGPSSRKEPMVSVTDAESVVIEDSFLLFTKASTEQPTFRSRSLSIGPVRRLLTLRGNCIEGATCLYGGGEPSPSVSEMRNLRGNRKADFANATGVGDGVMVGNQFGLLSANSAFLEFLCRPPTPVPPSPPGPGADIPVPGGHTILFPPFFNVRVPNLVFRHLAVSDNTFLGAGHVFLGVHVSLVGNLFNVPADPEIHIGWVVGLAAAITNNQSTRPEDRAAPLVSAAVLSQKATYLDDANQVVVDVM